MCSNGRGEIASVLVAWPLLLSACTSDDRTPFLIYSPHGRELLSRTEALYEARNPGIDVRWLDMGSQDVLDRVRSERANPQADVWWGGPNTLFIRAADEGLLEPYRPEWAEHIDSVSRGDDDAFFGLYLTPAVLAYNTQVLSEDEAPNDWDDLLDPRFEQRVLIRDPPASGTMRTFFGMIIDRSVRETGDTADGMAWLRRLDGQTREYVLNPALLHEKLVRQEGWVTVWDLPDIQTQQRNGRPLEFVFPETGTPVIDDAIAIVKGAKHPDIARDFVEWIGTMEMQLFAVRDQYRLPARTDLPVDSLPEWARDVFAELRPVPIDWHRVANESAGWMRYWDRNVRGTGGAGR